MDCVEPTHEKRAMLRGLWRCNGALMGGVTIRSPAVVAKWLRRAAKGRAIGLFFFRRTCKVIGTLMPLPFYIFTERQKIRRTGIFAERRTQKSAQKPEARNQHKKPSDDVGFIEG
jgi:hypothetical protein